MGGERFMLSLYSHIIHFLLYALVFVSRFVSGFFILILLLLDRLLVQLALFVLRLRQSFQYRVNLLSDGGQNKLKLLLRLDEASALIAQMFKRRRDVDLASSFVHSSEYEVQKYVGTSSTRSIADER